MLLDLIRALLAALVAGVAPGWFWAKALGAGADRAERIAYAIALSVMLVPTAALVQARLLGTGVTLAITIISVVLVFATGLGAYLRFGPAKEPGEPLAPLPAPLGLPTLIPLIVAFALVLGALFGVVSGGWVVPLLVALLVLAAGAAHLLGARRRDTPRPPSWSREEMAGPGESPIISAARYALLAAVLSLVLLRAYIGPARHEWPFIRGVDQYEHAVMTDMTLSQGSTESFLLYPPGFHYLTAAISRLSGLEPLEIFPVLAPALLVLPPLALYALARRLWGWEVGVAAAGFAGLLADSTYLHFSEARYPNYVGAQFLLVLAIIALIGTYYSASPRAGLLLALLGSSTVLYHTVASFYTAVLLALVAALFLPYLLVHERRRGLVLLCSLALLGFLSVLYAWDTYDLPQAVAGLVGGSRGGATSASVAGALGTQSPYDLDHLLKTTSQSIVWLGLLGAVLLMTDRSGEANTRAYALTRATLLLWGLMMFVGSRTALSGFPERFERDLGIPLALFAALALVMILHSLKPRVSAEVLAASLAVLLVGTVVGLQAVRNLEEAAAPSPQLLMTSEIAAAGDWLRQHNTGGNIVVTPQLDRVPSRGMLAMGGYTGLQTFRPGRIREGRDFPGVDTGPVWDALWVLGHPNDERARRVLQEYDVRYVVLHKRPTPEAGPYYCLYPGCPDPRPFEGQEDLYRLVFENDQVVILAPREL